MNTMLHRCVDIELLEQGGRSVAVFAGGCFWCMQGPFDAEDGVHLAMPGYSGGDAADADYHSVCSGVTMHKEAMLVVYDSTVICYDTLLDIFWRNIDPTQEDGQFADRGSQYHTAIMYLNNEQRKQAVASRDRLDASGRFAQSIVVQILPYSPFYPAEDAHKDYYKNNPDHYKRYHRSSGRAGFIKAMWKDTTH